MSLTSGWMFALDCFYWVGLLPHSEWISLSFLWFLWRSWLTWLQNLPELSSQKFSTQVGLFRTVTTSNYSKWTSKESCGFENLMRMRVLEFVLRKIRTLILRNQNWNKKVWLQFSFSPLLYSPILLCTKLQVNHLFLHGPTYASRFGFQKEPTFWLMDIPLLHMAEKKKKLWSLFL